VSKVSIFDTRYTAQLEAFEMQEGRKSHLALFTSFPSWRENDGNGVSLSDCLLL
jgi:hypothetical protein